MFKEILIFFIITSFPNLYSQRNKIFELKIIFIYFLIFHQFHRDLVEPAQFEDFMQIVSNRCEIG